MTLPFSLVGEKVQLTNFTAADITDEYLGWLNDPLVTRYSNQRFEVHNRETCGSYLQSFEGTPNLFVSVRSLEADKAIGTMTAYISRHHGTADLGIMIGDKCCWGSGYAFEAWTTLINWLFNQRGLRKITAGTASVNKPMISLAERSGMTFEGRRVRQEIIEGEEVDILYFGLFADQ